MKHVSVLLLGIVVMASMGISAQNLSTFIPVTDNKYDLLLPMKATGSMQFQVKVKNNDTVAYTVSIDKPGMLPFNTWVNIPVNSQSAAPGDTVTFLLTLTVPSGTEEGHYLLVINLLATRNGNTQSVTGKTITIIVDNSQPSMVSNDIDYTTSKTVRVLVDGIDEISSFYTGFNPTSGYYGIRYFTIVLKKPDNTVQESKTLDMTKDVRAHEFLNLNPNTQYTCTITATDLAGNANTSNPEIAKTKPGAPTNFVASSISYCAIRLTWDAMPGATGYIVWYDQSPVVTTADTTNSFTGLNPNTSYNFKVRAVNNDGLGDISSINISTLAVSAPIFSSTLNICGESQTIQVSPIVDATSYTWTVQYPLTVNGGQSTTTSGNSVVVNTNGKLGASSISVYANTSCGITSNPSTGQLFIGVPEVVSNYPLAYFDGSTYNDVCNLQQITTDMTINGASSVYWSKTTSSPSNISWWQPGNNVSFYFYNIGQTAVFNIYASNNCGVKSYDFGFRSIDCGGGGGCDIEYTLSPNPASNKVKIVPNIPPPCDEILAVSNIEGFVSIYDQSGTLKKKVKNNQNAEVEVDISALKNGIYIIEINNNNKSIKKTLIVKH